MGLTDSERISMIRSAVLPQSTRVTDGRTELVWHTRYSIYAVERKNWRKFSIFTYNVFADTINDAVRSRACRITFHSQKVFHKVRHKHAKIPITHQDARIFLRIR